MDGVEIHPRKLWHPRFQRPGKEGRLTPPQAEGPLPACLSRRERAGRLRSAEGPVGVTVRSPRPGARRPGGCHQAPGLKPCVRTAGLRPHVPGKAPCPPRPPARPKRLIHRAFPSCQRRSRKQRQAKPRGLTASGQRGLQTFLLQDYVVAIRWLDRNRGKPQCYGDIRRNTDEKNTAGTGEAGRGVPLLRELTLPFLQEIRDFYVVTKRCLRFDHALSLGPSQRRHRGKQDCVLLRGPGHRGSPPALVTVLCRAGVQVLLSVRAERVFRKCWLRVLMKTTRWGPRVWTWSPQRTPDRSRAPKTVNEALVSRQRRSPLDPCGEIHVFHRVSKGQWLHSHECFSFLYENVKTRSSQAARREGRTQQALGEPPAPHDWLARGSPAKFKRQGCRLGPLVLSTTDSMSDAVSKGF